MKQGHEKEHEKHSGADAAAVAHAGQAVPTAAASHVGSGGWLPIETAPKDGRELLLFGPFVPTGGTYMDVGRWTDYADGFWDWGGDDSQPTHWMPLPSPPQAGTVSALSEASDTDRRERSDREIQLLADLAALRQEQERFELRRADWALEYSKLADKLDAAEQRATSLHSTLAALPQEIDSVIIGASVIDSGRNDWDAAISTVRDRLRSFWREKGNLS